jgi:hypothetical protein
VALTWRTASEVETLGFNVWRFAGAKAAKVNRTLIGAKAAGRTIGATYRLVDRQARPGRAYRYRLQVVSRDGTRACRASATTRVRR